MTIKCQILKKNMGNDYKMSKKTKNEHNSKLFDTIWHYWTFIKVFNM